MSKFADIVSDILLKENPAPQPGTTPPPNQQQANPAGNASKLLMDMYNIDNGGFKQLKDTFDQKFGYKTDINQIYNELNNTVPGGKYNIAAKYVNDTYIPFIDAFSMAVKQMTEGAKDQKPTMAAILQNILNDTAAYDPIFVETAGRIRQLPEGSRPLDYDPVHPNVNRATNTLRNESEKLAQTAVESLYNDTIFNAITKIIAKRTNVFERISSLKGVRRPFSNNLIKPVLLSWRKYTTLGEPGRNINWEKALAPLYGNWQKKVSGDFNKIVDGVTADNLITIAVLAGEYYLSLLRNVIVEQGATNNESLSFEDLCNLILNEAPLQSAADIAMQKADAAVAADKQATRARILKNVGQTRKAIQSSKFGQKTPSKADTSAQGNKTPEGATPLTQKEYDDISRGLGDGEMQDHRDFIIGGKSRYLGKTVFNLGTISKDPSREAKALLKAIKDIAYHIRKTPGANNVLKGISALATGMGPVN